MNITKRGGFEMKTALVSAAIWLALSLGLASPGLAQWIQNGVPVAAIPELQYSPRMVADGSGGAYIVWSDSRSGNTDIYLQRINKYGEPRWAEGGIAVASGSSSQGNPVICLDSSGYAIVAYKDLNVEAAGIYAQRVSGTGTLMWDAGGVPVITDVGYTTNLCIAAGASGSAIIGWGDAHSGSPDLYAQRLNSSGVKQWAASGIALCDATGDQGELAVTADGSGGAVFVWEDARTAGILPIYGQRISSAGAAQWTANGMRLNDSNTWQLLPRVVYTASNTAIVVWYEDRGAGNNVYAQNITSTGTRLWGNSGVGVSTAAGEQQNPCLALDGAGGAIFAWADLRTNPPYSDIYAQRLNSAGTPEWTANGVFVCDLAGSQVDPIIVSDGVHGAIVAWKDQRLSYDYDLMAQRIDGDGDPQWLMQGEMVCGALGNQTLPQIVSDAGDGAILAWADDRLEGNSTDIYAQRMEKHGYWGYPSPWLTSAVDVPHDEGGKVLLTWDPSYLDAFPEEIVTHYVIWRSTNGDTYAPFDSIDAYYLDAYQYAAATTADSGSAGEAPHWFKVRANTLMSDYWWESPVVRCYSVDNISPAPIFGLAAERSFEPAGLALSWEPNGEADLDHYAVYRGADADFQPGPENLIAAPDEAAYLDEGWRGDVGYWYKIAAVDVHGNESGYALLAPGTITDVDTPRTPAASYLAQNFPNPFNPTTKIAFGLSAPAHVSLRIYDAAGRLVRGLVESGRPAGNYSEFWDGKDGDGASVASGVYFYRLDAGSFTQTRKMILLR